MLELGVKRRGVGPGVDCGDRAPVGKSSRCEHFGRVFAVLVDRDCGVVLKRMSTYLCVGEWVK